MKNLIIASTSTVHGSGYLEYILKEVSLLFKSSKEVVFIPYARPSGLTHDAYTAIVAKAFKSIDIEIRGIHTYESPKEALKNAQGVFVGGGNTFLLVHELYKQELIHELKAKIARGIPYLGTSAGSNICGPTMQTTNDMPIIQPLSFETMGIIPFNINAHFLDPDLRSKHKGETRETRINEFHVFNSIPVLGLREGSWLEVVNDEIILKGNLTARWFVQNETPVELAPLTNLSLKFT